MKHTITPSAIRALVHRHMAVSALRANLSLSSRLARYKTKITIARSLEAAGGVQ